MSPLVAALLLAAQAAGQDIVVTGQPIAPASTGCRDRRCSVGEDSAQALARADEAFRNGDYARARRVLASALGRVRRYARAEPRPVASLYEALASVSLHDGDREAYQSSVAWQASVLRDNLPPGDPVVVLGDMALGDMWATIGNYVDADAVYRGAARAAAARGQARAADVLALRRAWLAGLRRDAALAERMLAAIEARGDVVDPIIRQSIPVVRLRLAALRGDVREVDRLIPLVRDKTAVAPTLIWSPVYNLPLGSKGEWADIGFWITPAGRTRDAAVLRGSPVRGWTKGVVRQIGLRRYAGSDGADVYRIEHYSVRSEYIVPTGTRIRQKEGEVGLIATDLTDPSANALIAR